VGYFFPAGKDGFSNEDEILVNVLRLDKGYSEVISWQTMVAFSTGPTAAEDWRNGFRRENVRQRYVRMYVSGIENTRQSPERTLTSVKNLF